MKNTAPTLKATTPGPDPSTQLKYAMVAITRAYTPTAGAKSPAKVHN